MASEKPSGAPSVSVIVPLQNAEAWVMSLVEDIHNSITSRIPFSEILLVDDQSRDKTWAVLRELKEVYEEMKIFRMRESAGLGACSVRGFLEAKSRIMFHFEPHCVWKAEIFWTMAQKRAEMGKGAVFAVRDSSRRRFREKAYYSLFRTQYIERWELPVPDAASPAQLFSKSDFDKVHVLLPENAVAPSLDLYLMFMFFGVPVDTYLLGDSLHLGDKRRSLPPIFSGLQTIQRCGEEIEKLRKDLHRIEGLLEI